MFIPVGMGSAPAVRPGESGSQGRRPVEGQQCEGIGPAVTAEILTRASDMGILRRLFNQQKIKR